MITLRLEKSCTAVIHGMITRDLECPWHDYCIICRLWCHGRWFRKFTVRFQPIRKELESSMYNNHNYWTKQLWVHLYMYMHLDLNWFFSLNLNLNQNKVLDNDNVHVQAWSYNVVKRLWVPDSFLLILGSRLAISNVWFIPTSLTMVLWYPLSLTHHELLYTHLQTLHLKL